MDIQWTFGMQDFDDVYFVRKKVFIEEQNIPEDIEIDEMDEKAHHLLLSSKTGPIATGRVYEKDGSHFIGRVCILAAERGKGLGRILMALLIRKASEMDAEKIYLSSQLDARGFYKRFGFTEFGETFDDGGIEHVWMVRH